jgi:hypothetical protein
MNKPYYNAPEQLEHLFTLSDPNASWNFSDVILVKDTTDGKIYAAHDSGCSCPSPFERHTFPTDFTEIKSVQEFVDYLKGLGGYPEYTAESIDSAIKTLYDQGL